MPASESLPGEGGREESCSTRNCWTPETTKKPTASELLPDCGGTVVESLPVKVDEEEEQGVPKTGSEEGSKEMKNRE